MDSLTIERESEGRFCEVHGNHHYKIKRHDILGFRSSQPYRTIFRSDQCKTTGPLEPLHYNLDYTTDEKNKRKFKCPGCNIEILKGQDIVRADFTNDDGWPSYFNHFKSLKLCSEKCTPKELIIKYVPQGPLNGTSTEER